MDETKVQIGEDVLLDIGIHSDWYISSIGYDGESVAVALRRKADRNKEWWLADTPQTDCGDFADRLAYERGVKHAWEVAQKVFDSTVTFYEAEDVAKQITDTPQTDCPWK